VLGQSSGTNFWVRPIYDTNLIRYFSITMIMDSIIDIAI